MKTEFAELVGQRDTRSLHRSVIVQKLVVFPNHKHFWLIAERTSCVRDTFGSYTIAEADNTTINGALTRDENVADLIGTAETYRVGCSCLFCLSASSFEAYHHWLETRGKQEEEPWPHFDNYTSDQMFFLSYANVSASSKFETSSLNICFHHVGRTRCYGRHFSCSAHRQLTAWRSPLHSATSILLPNGESTEL